MSFFGSRDSFDEAILTDLDRLEGEFGGIQSSFVKYRDDFVSLERVTR